MAGTEFTRDVSQLLAAGMLVLAFAFLGLRGPRRLIDGLAAQGVLLATVAAWQGWARGEWALAATAAVTLVGSGLAVPATLRAAMRQPGKGDGSEPVARPAASLAAGMALVAAAVLTGLVAGDPKTREALVVAASVLLLGMLVAATRRDALGPALGLCCAARGALLLALLVPAMPLPGVLAAGIAVLEATLAAALLARRMPAGFEFADLLAAAAPPSRAGGRGAAETREAGAKLLAFLVRGGRR